MAGIEINVGDRFGAWTIVKEAPSRKMNKYYICECDCGAKREVFRGSLIGRRSKSCGCRENVRNEK